MRYETPEIQELGEASEEIKSIFTANPMDFEASTGRVGYTDPCQADH